MFRHIRTKFATALAVPLAVLVALAGLGVVHSQHQQRTAKAQRASASAALSPTGLVSALQNERNEGSLQLLGLDQVVNLGVRSNAQARAATGLATSQFEGTLAGSASASGVYEGALSDLGALTSLRHSADAFMGARAVSNAAAQATATSLYEGYTALISRFLDAASGIAPTITDVTLRNGAEILDAALRQSEAQAQVVHDVFDASFAGGFATNRSLAAATGQDLGGYLAWTARLATLGQAPYHTPVTILTGPKATATFEKVVQSYLAGAQPNVIQLLGTTAAAGKASSGITPYKKATSQVANLAKARSDKLVSNATRQLILLVVLGVLALLFGLVVLLRISHSISKPLVRLARQADELAAYRLGDAVETILGGGTPTEEQLPTIDTAGRDEVASVARAMSAVRERAILLATEQSRVRRNLSEALTNLGRRNQNLVTRQLDYISAVEKSETDPDTLDQLFKLDHLATRMRRNAESLLVLGGAESPRRWSMPVAIVDVVRSALSEVEDFRRVQLRTLEPATIAGNATADVAHLVAEMLENALTNSPPDAPVLVAGELTPDGYRFRLADSGIGMSDEALEQANLRLAGSDSFVDGVTRYLGLYVAGQLAARHGVKVRLQHSSTSSGLEVLLDIPLALLPERAAAETQEAKGLAPAETPTTTTPVEGDVAADPLESLFASFSTTTVLASESTNANGNGHGQSAEPRGGGAPEPAAPWAPVGTAVVPAPVELSATPDPAPAPASTADFEAWLNSRLDQLEQMSLDQAVVAAPATESAGIDTASWVATESADGNALLPRRRPTTDDGSTSASLIRRQRTEPSADAEGGARVNSSLFRYLSAVDQRPKSSN